MGESGLDSIGLGNKKVGKFCRLDQVEWLGTKTQLKLRVSPGLLALTQRLLALS